MFNVSRIARLGTWLGLLASIAAVTDAQQLPTPLYTSAATDDLQVRQNRDYDALLQRLQDTEERLQWLERDAVPSTQQVAMRHHAPGPAIQNDQAPSTEVLQRLTAVEKSVADTQATKYPNAKLSGFFHLDGGVYSQDAANRATLGDLQDGVGFRRARLQALGSVSEFTNYSVEMDFGIAGRPSLVDVWGEQTHVPILGNLRIGQFRQATTMDGLTPIRQLSFLERSAPFQALDPFRRVGIMAYDKSEDEMWSWAYGAYKTGAFNNLPLGDTRFGTDIGDVGGYSFATRLTHLLHYDEAAEGRYLLHVGGHYNYSRITASTTNPVPIYDAQAIPEFFVGDPAGGGLTANGTPPFVNTGRLAADEFHFFGAQLAGQRGPFHFQAEYMGTSVQQIGNPSVFYDGAYVQTGYFLTGENRTYNRMFGVFDRITPFTDFFGLGRDRSFCGWGAWELTGRWSYVNLNDPNAVPLAGIAGPPPSVNPGRLHETSLGMNWYWNAYSKMQFVWMHCFLDNAVQGDSDCDIFAGRFQVEF